MGVDALRPQASIVELAKTCLLQQSWPSGLCVDMTAGNGFDALFLAQSILHQCFDKLLIIDIQKRAMESCRARFDRHFGPHAWPLVNKYVGCHSQIAQLLDNLTKEPLAPSVSLAMYNLGYLPGSDKGIITQPLSTLVSLKALKDRIMPGGGISLMLYVGHDGGAEEANVVEQELLTWDSSHWALWQLKRLDAPNAPLWIWAQRRKTVSA